MLGTSDFVLLEVLDCLVTVPRIQTRNLALLTLAHGRHSLVPLKRTYFCPEPKPIIRPSSGIKVKLSLYQAVEALGVLR
jgi:hypothetical protein